MGVANTHLLAIPSRRSLGLGGKNAIERAFAFSDDADIVIAQYANLRRQVPLLYVLLVVTASAAFYTFTDTAPLWLISAITLLIVSLSVLRIISWVWFSPAADDISVEKARSILRRTTLAVIPICVIYVGYALVLDQYAGPIERAGLAVCVVLTAIGCIFCLAHLPQAGLLVHVLTMLPYTTYHLIAGNSVFVMVAFNAAIVTTLMLRVSRNAFEGFTELITSRAELVTQRSEAQRLADENERLALTDALTGLPNRRHFFAHLDQKLALAKPINQSLIVGVLDLDRFKPVNDIYGHAVGDQLLAEIGTRLRSLESSNIFVARLGGDEFGMILSADDVVARDIADRIISLLNTPFFVDDNRLSIGGSIGFSCFPEAGRTASEIFDRADYALYDVKTNNKGRHGFFTQDLEIRHRNETEMETALLTAELERELTVEMQPIVSLETGTVIGIEALGRWDSAVIGKIEPARFIETAERLNLMGIVTTTLFRNFLRDACSLPTDLILSFNLSTHDIVSAPTIDRLVAAIIEEGVQPERITFEITETALVRDYQVAFANLERMRSLGISIALDDFGTGFSSLSYLSHLPIDKVKVDRSFLRNLTEPGAAKLVDVILGMCDKLGLECIVEGVETQQQLNHLLMMGCSKAQGFLFSRPLKIAALKAWLDDAADKQIAASRSAYLLSLPSLGEHRYLHGSSRKVG